MMIRNISYLLELQTKSSHENYNLRLILTLVKPQGPFLHQPHLAAGDLHL